MRAIREAYEREESATASWNRSPAHFEALRQPGQRAIKATSVWRGTLHLYQVAQSALKVPTSDMGS